MKKIARNEIVITRGNRRMMMIIMRRTMVR